MVVGQCYHHPPTVVTLSIILLLLLNLALVLVLIGDRVVAGRGFKGEGKHPDPIIAEMFTEMKTFLGYPDKTDKDPIPNYAKEGQFLKKMVARHFTRDEILSCWKAKVRQRRREFVSMAWVNEDIAAHVHRQEKGGDVGQREPGEREPDPVRAMRQAGWSTEGDGPDESGKPD